MPHKGFFRDNPRWVRRLRELQAQAEAAEEAVAAWYRANPEDRAPQELRLELWASQRRLLDHRQRELERQWEHWEQQGWERENDT